MCAFCISQVADTRALGWNKGQPSNTRQCAPPATATLTTLNLRSQEL